MKTKRTLLVAGAVSATVLSALSASAVVLQPLIVPDPFGTVGIQQALPCGDDLETKTRIAGGRIEVTPASVREQMLFELTRMDLFLEPFSVDNECQGIHATAQFFEIDVRLAGAVTFPAEAVEPPESGQFRFTIPKDQFLIYESVLDNAQARQPETMYQKPSEDVTGLIDLRNRTVEFHVTLASQLHFRAGCVGNTCVIDVVKDGTQAADVEGKITKPTRH
jgi:hypothetical protein